jgi:hypothetical protein
MESVDFDLLVGQKAKLYACNDNDINCFQLGVVKFEVEEDASDGYRSHFQGIKIHSTQESTNLFLDNVEICTSTSMKNGYTLISTSDGHEWLEFGTSYSDIDYPCFVFSWVPKPPLEEQLKQLINL